MGANAQRNARTPRIQSAYGDTETLDFCSNLISARHRACDRGSKKNGHRGWNLIRCRTQLESLVPGKPVQISAAAVYRLMDTGKYFNFRAARRARARFIKRGINRGGRRNCSRSSLAGSWTRARARSARSQLENSGTPRWTAGVRAKETTIYFPIDDDEVIARRNRARDTNTRLRGTQV